MKKTNRLINASSPYLQQHAYNPVDWYEWSDEALEIARTKDKPLIISIGYAACHWCHVMVHESFEDETIAGFMNDNFVCIKVDREERPDIDQIYMDAAHITSGRGGWPLNAIALPDGRPFFAATYFQPQQWLNLLQQLKDIFDTDKKRVLNAAESITKGINTIQLPDIQAEKGFSKDDYHLSFENHVRNIDFKLGGYRKAPKFMKPVGLEFFLQYHFLTGNQKALDAFTVSLDAMARGGLNDQVGGGFARYSTDERWLVPHFEKMLYDNAQLISLYSKAYQITENPFYKEIVDKTIAFAERELRDESGGFYSSLDADSEHEEGKFYIFTKEELVKILSEEYSELIFEYYNISSDGNWEHGKNIFHITTDNNSFAQKHNLSQEIFEEILEKANLQIFDYRAKRVRPQTDDKILCSWNALMISAYADAYKATGNTDYLTGALTVCRFIEQNLLKPDGNLLRVFRNGKVSVDAFLDDYVLLAKAFIDVYQVTFDVHWLDLSRQLTEYTLIHFLNEEKNMFYYTSDESSGLIARKYELSDNVIPASNSVMAHVLFQLSFLFDKPDWKEISDKMLAQVLTETSEYGAYYSNWAQLLGKQVYGHSEVVITGQNAMNKSLEIQKKYLPLTIFAGGNEENLPVLKDRITTNKTLIYLCENNVCGMPMENVNEVSNRLNSKNK